MLIAGIELDSRSVLEVAALLREKQHDRTAFRLERACYALRREYPISRAERRDVLRVLDERPHLSRLRTALEGS